MNKDDGVMRRSRKMRINNYLDFDGYLRFNGSIGTSNYSSLMDLQY
jgi:hypothetical protein